MSKYYSEWIAKELSELTDYSHPYYKDRLPHVDYEKLRKWIEETKPDLNTLSLNEALRRMEKEKSKK